MSLFDLNQTLTEANIKAGWRLWMKSAVLERDGNTYYRISATRQHCHQCKDYTSCLFPHTPYRGKTKWYCSGCMGKREKAELNSKKFKKKEGYELFLCDTKTHRVLNQLEGCSSFTGLVKAAEILTKEWSKKQ